jgi:hypothetical protein
MQKTCPYAHRGRNEAREAYRMPRMSIAIIDHKVVGAALGVVLCNAGGRPEQ